MVKTPAKSMLYKIVAADIMTEDVVVIKEDMLIGQVAHLMLRNKVSGYPIVNESKQVVGVVTINDLFALIDRTAWDSLRSSSSKGKEDWQDKIGELKDRPIKEIMTRNVISITPETPVFDIIEAVVKWRIHTFPVMKNNKLVGIIGRHDVLNATFVYS